MDKDPWREMAIEKQFRPLIDQDEVDLDHPATLAYLEKGIYDLWEGCLSDENTSYNLHVSEFQRMDTTYDFFLNSLSYNRYATALVHMLWGSDTTIEDAMECVLDEPGQLLSEAGRFGYTLIGM